MSRHANQRRLGAGKFRAILSSILAIGLAIGGITGLAAAPAAAVGNGQDNHTPVTICHSTASGSNPYVVITVDDDSIVTKLNSPNNHQFHHDGRDIIPAFDYHNEDGILAHFDGQNLGAIAALGGLTGEWLLANGCSTDGVPAPTLTIAKSAFVTGTETPVGSLQVGDKFDYVITVTNTGVIAASKVVITDAIPSSITVLDTTYPDGWACAIAGTDLNCTIDSLAAAASAASAAIVLHVEVAAGAPDSVTNTAEACADNTSPLCVIDDAIITVIRPAIDLVKTSDVSDGSVASGETFNYMLQVSNPGTAPATGVYVEDTLPQYIVLNGTPAPTTGWTFTSGTNAIDPTRTNIKFTLDSNLSLAPGSAVTFTVPVKASDGLPSTLDPILNEAVACAGVDCDTDDETLQREWITLGVESVCTTDYVQQVKFTLRTNGVKYTTDEGGPTTPVATLSVAGGAPVLVGIGQNGLDVTRTQPWSAVLGSPVTATIDGVSATGVYPAKDTSCVAPGDLSVEKTQGVVGTDTQTGDPIDVVPGNVIRYVVTVKNIGGTAIGGTVTDTLPSNLKFQSVSPTAPNATWSSISVPLTEVGGTVTATLASPLAPDATASFEIFAQVVRTPGVGGVTNKACLTENECDSVTAHVPAIDIIKHVWESEGNQNGSDEFAGDGDGATVAGGSLLDYTLTVTNTGEGALSGVQVVDNLPSYLKVAGAIDESVWTVVASGGDEGYGATLTFTLKAGVLAQGESSLIKIPVSVHPTVSADELRNNAQVCASSELKTELCDEDGVTVDVLVDRQIDILKTAFDSESGEAISTEGTGLLPGTGFYYLLEVANVGDGVLVDTVITDKIPAGIRVDEIVTDPAGETPYWRTCDVEGEDADGFGGTLTCELSEPLAPGSDAPAIRLNVTIMSGDPATDGGNGVSITNAAKVCGYAGTIPDQLLLARSVESADQVCADDDAIVPVDIPTLPVEDADIDIDKSVTLGKNDPNTSDYVNKDGVPVVNAGSRLLYTLVISNAGPGAATGVEVTDTLPAELRIPEGAVIVADGWTLVDGTDHSFGESLTFVREAGDETSDSLGTGASWTILIPVEVNPDSTKVAAGTIVNTAAACAENDFISPNGSEELTGCETDDATVLIETLEVPTLPLPEPEVPTLALTGSDGFNGTLAIGLLALTGGIGILAAARRKGQRV